MSRASDPQKQKLLEMGATHVVPVGDGASHSQIAKDVEMGAVSKGVVFAGITNLVVLAFSLESLLIFCCSVSISSSSGYLRVCSGDALGRF